MSGAAGPVVVSQVSRSPWPTWSRVVPRVRSQARKVTAALTRTWAVPGVGAWPGRGGGLLAQSAQHPPGGVGLDQAPVGGVGDGGELVADPLLEPGQGFVACGQHAAGDEHVTQVVRGPAVGVGVQGVVADR